MPFTLSHVAAVLPFAKPALRHASVSGMIIGSMIPDLQYFIRVGPSADFAHSFAGLFLYCVPAGLVAFVVFHGIMKRPLFLLLPPFLARCIPSEWVQGGTRRKGWLVILLSVLFGACTHTFLDSFTHLDGAVVERVPWLKSDLMAIGGYSIRPYRILQHGGTLAGLGILFIYLLWLWRRAEIVTTLTRGHSDYRFQPVILVFLFVLTAGAAFAGAALIWQNGSRSAQPLIMAGVFSALPPFLLGLLLYCIVWTAKSKLQVDAVAGQGRNQ